MRPDEARPIKEIADRPGQGYVRVSSLIGGVVLTAVGTLLLLRPEWLSFGR